MQHIIAHFDLDSFFVSVEILKNPALKGKPVIVGGEQRGVVSTCSYEARKFGVHSAMPSAKAKQLCPQGIFIKGSYADYGKYSRMVTDIIAAEAPVFEKASIDEFYVDLTGMEKFFNPLQWTIDLRKKIIDETGLPISFGLSCNKLVAKIATNQAKPNGYLHVPFGKEQEFLAPLAVGEIPGVGKHMQESLHKLNVFTIGELAQMSIESLEEYFGKWGVDLYHKSRGEHQSLVGNRHEAKSISTENTFSDNKSDKEFLYRQLVAYTEKVCYELRQDGKFCSCVAVKLRYPDFTTVSRQATIPPTDADDEIIPIVKQLFDALWKKPREPIRLMGVRLSNFTDHAIQTNIFNNIEKKSDLYSAIDNVRNRFGKGLVKRASSDGERRR